MYRKRNGSLGFSFTTFVNNAVPNLAADPHRFAYCAPLGKDMLYAHQISATHPDAPYALDERSLFVGGICDKESIASKVFYKLTKAGILNEQGCVDTRKIDGKKFAHQIAVLSVPRQRELVNLLFWWEEECMRLRKLIDEEKDLKENIKAIEKQGSGEDGEEDENDAHGYAIKDDVERRQLLDRLRFEREKLRMRIRQRPSERREDVESGTDALYAEAYAPSANNSGRSQSVPTVSVHGKTQNADPPAYHL